MLTAGLPPVEDVERKMRDLHPDGPDIVTVDEDATHSFNFTVNAVTAAIESFDSSSGPGPSGLRPAHLKDILKSTRRRFSSDSMRLFTAARLVALPKSDGGSRPIAMGDTLRRLAATCLHSVVLASVCSVSMFVCVVGNQRR